MSLQIDIPDALAQQLQERAVATGIVPEQVAINAIERQLKAEQNYERLMAPVHQAFRESGMTEEELSDLLEEEKHAMRRERREHRS
jgi:hypothetical protein